MLIPLSSAARARLAACLFLSVLGLSLPALAWKPITHVYLAEKARAELIAQNGSITLHQVDPVTQQQGTALGTWTVSPSVYQALRDYPAYFRAGVLGPDAYPDMLFGQSVIHPATEDDGSDTEPWLRHLYNRASTPQQRAFVLGFLSHAAGDMFGHTLINHYAGGPFDLMSVNAKRHIVAEGHVGRRTPFLGDLSSGEQARYTIDTAAVNTFIYDNMIDARRARNGNGSNEVWRLTRSTQAASLPRLFTELRAGLEDKIDGYYDHIRWLKQQYRENADRCRWYRPGPCIKAAYYKVVLVAYKLIGGLPVYYMEAWIRDINRGLKAWPAASTEVARALFMSTTHKGDFEGAKAAVSNYTDRYLCSMLGAPDAFCTLSSIIEDIISSITFKLDLFKALKQAILNYVVKKATGEDFDYWKSLMDPEPYQVDQEVPTNPSSTTVTSSQQLDQLMWVSGTPARFNMLKFAPAYNTYASIKMSFLDTRTQWKSVLGAAGWNPANMDAEMSAYDQPNGFNGQLLLGFIRSLDWDNQWAVPERMFIVQDCQLFNRFFMKQTGDLWGAPHRQGELTAWCENISTTPGEPVGVIPATNSCPTLSSTVRFFMDNQDSGNSYVSGWVGGTSVDSNRNTNFVFCRVDGNRFRSLASYSTGRANYAVLKLGASCPPGSVEFSRYFDNEDSDNKNRYEGDIWPNTVSGYGTELRFCLFKGSTSTSATLPNVGFDYGVFASSSFGFTSGTGVIYTDDENNNNANRYAITDSGSKTAAVSIISEGTNTTLRTARVRNPVCGDYMCNGLETESSCPQDCDYCGNGSCSASEDLYSCNEDCGWCGDGYCAPGEYCSSDCGTTCQPSPTGELCQMSAEM
jgi:hypothetical protein